MPTPAKQAARAPAKQAARPSAQTAKPAARPAAAPTRPAAAKPSTAVAPRAQTAVATPGAGVPAPAYMQQGGNRGSEQVGMQDVVIPRIELVQALSPCLKEGDAAYIEGAKPGMFYNSVTRELFGAALIVCPVFFKKQYLAWRDRKLGGGFGGAFDSAGECNDAIQGREDPENWEAMETAQQIVLVVNMEDYSTTEAVLSCSRTKMKVSRQWNSLIRINGHDRFSRIYELSSVDESNTQNQDYKNIMVRYVDWAPETVYRAAEDLYNNIASGLRRVVTDDNYDETVIDAETVSGGDGAPPEY